jgi:DNA repair protein RadC
MKTETILTDSPEHAERTIDTAEDVFLLLAAEAAGLKESRLWRIDLDRDNRVIGGKLDSRQGAVPDGLKNGLASRPYELIADRGADTIMIHPRLVFGGDRGAVAVGAAKIILAHNHPTGRRPCGTDSSRGMCQLSCADQNLAAHMTAKASPNGRQCRSLPLPTDEDYILTDLMALAGAAVGVPLQDHVIITDKEYFSFRDSGWR